VTVSRVRAGVSPARLETWRVPPEEKAQLRATLGVALRLERSNAGRSQAWLARATGADRSTIRKVEAGDRRPSGALLRSVASALDPDDPRPLAARLCAAAGSSLARDTPGKCRHWQRRAAEAMLAGRRPLPTRIARAVELHTAASRAHREAMAILDRPGALDDPEALGESCRLMDEARRLRAEAGPPFTLHVAGREFSYGFGL
jgi:transcriptional regulator with XRE-family HTH domain